MFNTIIYLFIIFTDKFVQLFIIKKSTIQLKVINIIDFKYFF